MKLIYCYIKHFRNIEEQEVSLSDEYSFAYDGECLSIQRTERDKNLDYLYGNGFMRNMHIVVGKTGAGKTNFLQLIGMNHYEREKTVKSDAYFLLYKLSDSDDFAVEIVGLEISGLTQRTYQSSFLRFRYNFTDNTICSPRVLQNSEYEDTFIVNSFDRYAFAHCPYEDERIESLHGNDRFLPRIISQFGKSHASLECECLQEYLSGFAEENIKRKSSFEISWNNWQNKLEISLDEDLLKSDYWTYKSRVQEQRMENLKAGKFNEPIVFPEKSTPKSRFIHDLMTDFAIYLRKQAECVDPDFPEKHFPYCGYTHDLGIRNTRELPDGKKMGILKRINWLCQYIDYHTDELTSNKGLVWQIGQDICDLFSILNRIEDRYFSDDVLSVPVMEIDLGHSSAMHDFFERIDQYRPDEVGIFSQQLLPYHWTYVSSGEYQYAKVWSILEEYGVRVKMLSQGQTYREARHPNIILLLDEPECYMHPEMCRGFISHLSRILNRRNLNTEFQVILSTHSPFMLSDVLSSQIIKMDFNHLGRCVISQGTKPYFAANIHSIMADGFFLQYTIGEQARSFISEKIGLLKEMISRKESLSNEDKMEIEKITNLIPQIGDELIQKCLTCLIGALR